MVTMAHYHGRNLRIGRISEAGRPYLVTTVTHNRHPLFLDWRIGRLLVLHLRDATEQGYVDTLAWVVMPDHLHWLMVPGSESVNAAIRRVKSRSARAINQKLGAAGPVWQKGYHDHAVRRQQDMRALARYVIANPLRAGLVESIGDYPLWDAIWL
jgi:REP element-mobilizing transposase RayT